MRSTPAVAASAILVLAGTGCGSSSNSNTASSSPSTPTSSVASQPAKATAPARTTTTPGKVGEVNPAGDIPDNQAYVRYTAPGRGVSLKAPEGWSRVTAPTYVLFTDKLNSIRLEVGKPTTVAATLARLSRTVPGFQKQTVSTVQRPAGTATRITYLARSAPNAVTGKRVTDAVERYAFAHQGRAVIVTLSGPRGADNVDPWRIVTTSVRFTR